jgi:hypothetical protein
VGLDCIYEFVHTDAIVTVKIPDIKSYEDCFCLNLLLEYFILLQLTVCDGYQIKNNTHMTNNKTVQNFKQKAKGKRSLWRPRHRWVYNMKEWARIVWFRSTFKVLHTR